MSLTPHVIKAAPKNLVRLTFPNGIKIEPGAILVSHQIISQPEIIWNAELNELYTLLLVDSTALSTKLKESPQICHWMVINIPGNQVYRGKAVIAYHAPAKRLRGNGIHRFICLIFKQANLIATENFVFKITERQQIIVKSNDYKTKYSLGTPVAGNFFNVRDEA